MNQEFLEEEVIVEKKAGIGIITLNNPRVLNALSLEMIRPISSALNFWKDDDEVKAVLFKACNGRAFCAGGDVKAFYYAGMDYRKDRVSARVPLVFFSEEYYMNKQITEFPKPTIALIDGIVMGGGYGIAGHCDHRIVSENALFAMPEVQIGFFPDVGSMYHLARTPHHVGRYCAMTGARLDAGDMLAAGLADHFIASGQHENFCESLTPEAITQNIEALAKPAPAPWMLDMAASEIEKAFDVLEVGAVIESLKSLSTDWAEDTLGMLRQASPMSVCVAAEYLKRAEEKSAAEILEMDYTVVQHFIDDGNMYEGIRAALIDKDKNPEWEYYSFETIGDIEQNTIDRYFVETDRRLSDVEIFES